MKVITRYIIRALFTTTIVTFTAGAMFDFHLTETFQNYTGQERNCRDIGYDGLAVISTPEAFSYALKLFR